MKKQDLENTINEVVNSAFESITHLYEDQHVDTRLIFPKYTHGKNKGKKRVSEQELRQLFIEELNKYCEEKKLDLQYSVETPTKKKYSFLEDGEPMESEDGVSGRYDLTIWEKDEMVAIIEFKEGNATKHEYKKDLYKLTNKNEGTSNALRYIVNVLESSNSATIKSIENKFSDGKKGSNIIHLRFHSMQKPVHNQEFPDKYLF